MKLKGILCCALAVAILALSGCNPAEVEEFDVSTVELSDSQLAQVDEDIEKALTEKEFSGGAIVNLNVNKVYENYFGYKTKANKKKIDSNTVYQISSLTRTFTGVAISLLADEGKISLDDSLAVFFDSSGDNEYLKDITVEDLLKRNVNFGNYHTEIVKTNEDLERFEKQIKKNPKELEDEIVAHILKNGTEVKGGNAASNHYLLGKIVEKASGKSFKKYIQESILDKLGLKNTGFVSIKDKLSGYHIDDEKWRSSEDNPVLNSFSFLYSSFGMTSSVGDLSKFYSALLYGELTETDIIDEVKKSSTKYNYGLTIDGKNIHAEGSTYLHSSYVFINPDNFESAVLLSNQTGKTDISTTGKDIYQIINSKINGIILEFQEENSGLKL